MSQFSKVITLLIVGSAITLPAFTYSAPTPEPPILVREEKLAQADRQLYVPGEILVKFKSGANEDAIQALERAHSILEDRVVRSGKFRTLRLPEGASVPGLAEVFRNNPLVEYAEPNYYRYASFIPNDPLYGLQWHLDNPVYGGIEMEQAWNLEEGGDSNVVVAVIDTGVAYENHPSTKCWHRDTYNAYSGSGYSWWCGLTSPNNWATPPGYDNFWEQYLTHSFDLTLASGTVTLSYRYKHDMESNFDFGYTEISTNSGSTWTALKSYTGKTLGAQNGWKVENINITSYSGNNILLRFRFNSDNTFSDGDGYDNSDGAWYIDEISITDGAGTIFSDNVEGGVGSWAVDSVPFGQAPDLAGTSFWINTDEVAGNSIDDDGNGYVDDRNGWDFVDSDAHPNDDVAHGTHVTGTIAQTTKNSLGVAGIAFNATIMPVKVLGPGGGTDAQVADGIYYATDNGADIINMSLGGSFPSTTLENAVSYAYSNGVTVVAACGNSGTSGCDYPARYNSYVIAVGATQYNQTKAPYSSYGSGLDVVAPGGNTSVDQNGDGYADGVLQQTFFSDNYQDWAYVFYQGTSMATPHVAGVAALLKARNSSLTPAQIQNTLQSTAEDLGSAGYDSTYGYGLVDAYAALSSIPAVSITLTTDGTTPFGVVNAGATVDTTASGTNDVQTVQVTTGPANLSVKSTAFSDGSNVWSLGSSNGSNQTKWEFSPNATAWSTFLTPGVSYSLATNVAQNNSQNLYLRLTMPTDTSSTAEHSSTVTIMATAP